MDSLTFVNYNKRRTLSIGVSNGIHFSNIVRQVQKTMLTIQITPYTTSVWFKCRFLYGPQMTFITRDTA